MFLEVEFFISSDRQDIPYLSLFYIRILILFHFNVIESDVEDATTNIYVHSLDDLFNALFKMGTDELMALKDIDADAAQWVITQALPKPSTLRYKQRMKYFI